MHGRGVCAYPLGALTYISHFKPCTWHEPVNQRPRRRVRLVAMLSHRARSAAKKSSGRGRRGRHVRQAGVCGAPLSLGVGRGSINTPENLGWSIDRYPRLCVTDLIVVERARVPPRRSGGVRAPERRRGGRRREKIAGPLATRGSGETRRREPKGSGHNRARDHCCNQPFSHHHRTTTTPQAGRGTAR